MKDGLGWCRPAATCQRRAPGRLLLHGQTNFIRMLWRFNRVYNGKRQLADHARLVRYELPGRGLAPSSRQPAQCGAPLPDPGE
jgi:hypothetical protein